MKIAIIVGTRPEAIKLLPVYFALKESKVFDPVLISSGQHKDMLNNIWDLFQVTPDISMDIQREDIGLYDLTAKLLLGLGKILSTGEYKGVIIQGDTTTALSGALVGFYNQIKVIHVEAGLRTNNKHFPFPEETNRQLITRLTDIHFPPTKLAYTNLRKENVEAADMLITGNTIIDSLNWVLKETKKNADKYEAKFEKLIDNPIILITGHRRENFGEAMERIWEVIGELARENSNMNFVFPTHYNPNVYNKVREVLGNVPNIHLIDPLPYDEMVFLMSKSTMIMTDSGGIQEEAPSLGVPVMITRNSTERTEVIKKNLAFLVGHDRTSIRRVFYELVRDKMIHTRLLNIPNPYGIGDASDKIRRYLEQKLMK